MKEHVHKYQRVILGGIRVVKRDGAKYIERCGGQPVMKCMLAGCTHYIASEIAVGRFSICWKCGGEMVLNTENITLKNPTHKECRKKRVKEEAA